MAFLGLAACSTDGAQKAAPGHHVSTGSSSPTATGSYTHWEAMFRESVTTGDPEGAAQSLTIIAERWPGAVGRFSKPALYYAIRGAPEGDAQYRLYRAFLATEGGRQAAEGGYLWREFALLQLQRGEADAAAAALGFITYPYIVVSVQADKRFDAIRPRISPPLDVDRAAKQEIEAARSEVKLHPDRLEATSNLMLALIHARNFAEAVDVGSTAVGKAGAARTPVEYTDYQKQYVWVLNNYADALGYVGRWRDAVQQLETASRMPEDGHDNISQVISLASLYTRLGQPAAARQTLLRLPPRLSPYGDMQKAAAELESAVQLGDREETVRALVFMRARQADAPYTYEQALLGANQPDDAAQVLIARLKDPATRDAALRSVQHYGNGATTARQRELDARWQTMQTMPEVREAIAAVGYVASYPSLMVTEE
ncbi:MAG TPA: hypothetical protein VH109_07635 [Steroidobacteraceae bacterium]|nr:hypothetical protein [Steroidobacteraceae bacterium]